MYVTQMRKRNVTVLLCYSVKKWISYREKYLENLEIQEGACTFASQTLNLIEHFPAEQIQPKEGFRENDSTLDRV